MKYHFAYSTPYVKKKVYKRRGHPLPYDPSPRRRQSSVPKGAKSWMRYWTSNILIFVRNGNIVCKDTKSVKTYPLQISTYLSQICHGY